MFKKRANRHSSLLCESPNGSIASNASWPQTDVIKSPFEEDAVHTQGLQKSIMHESVGVMVGKEDIH